MKFLDPRTHGVLDYVVVMVLAIAPALFDFGGLPAVICYAVALVHLVLSQLTAYSFGIAQLIPFPLHGGIELLTGIFLVLAPSLLDFSPYASAPPLFAVMGLCLGLLWALTDYKAVPDPYRTWGMYRARIWTH